MPRSNPQTSNALFAFARRSARVREVSFCKRCVVAYELRGVAFVYGQSPKRVLIGAFQKCRRAALTEKSKRRSRRLALLQSRVQEAGVLEGGVQERVRFSRVGEFCMTSAKSSSWRSLSVCVSSVLRDVRVDKSTTSKPTAPSQVN